jgi:hypothetical protein
VGNASDVSSLSVSYGTSLTAGSKLIAYVTSYGDAAETVEDAHGNEMGVAAGWYINIDQTPSVLDMYFYVYCMDTPSADAGTAATIEATFSTPTQATMGLQEVSGLASGSGYAAVDGDFAYNEGETVSSNEIADAYPSYEASYANEYMISALSYQDESSLTGPAGWTLDPNISATNYTGAFGMALAYTTTVAGTNDGPWEFPGTSNGNCFVILDFAFLLGPATSPPVPVRTNFRRQAVKRAAYY